MKFSVSHIRRNAYEEPFNFSGEVDVSEVETLNNDIRKATDATVEGSCVIEGDEFVFNLSISGKVILPCALTLVDVEHVYDIKAIEIFSDSDYYGKEEEENDIHEITSEMIDLTPLIKENILLNLPYRVYTDDKVKLDQAVKSGSGWNFSTEEEHVKKVEDSVEADESIDPRLKKLKQLLDDEEE